jgi:hypothetical protein
VRGRGEASRFSRCSKAILCLCRGMAFASGSPRADRRSPGECTWWCSPSPEEEHPAGGRARRTKAGNLENEALRLRPHGLDSPLLVASRRFSSLPSHLAAPSRPAPPSIPIRGRSFNPSGERDFSTRAKTSSDYADRVIPTLTEYCPRADRPCASLFPTVLYSLSLSLSLSQSGPTRRGVYYPLACFLTSSSIMFDCVPFSMLTELRAYDM